MSWISKGFELQIRIDLLAAVFFGCLAGVTLWRAQRTPLHRRKSRLLYATMWTVAASAALEAAYIGDFWLFALMGAGVYCVFVAAATSRPSRAG